MEPHTITQIEVAGSSPDRRATTEDFSINRDCKGE